MKLARINALLALFVCCLGSSTQAMIGRSAQILLRNARNVIALSTTVRPVNAKQFPRLRSRLASSILLGSISVNSLAFESPNIQVIKQKLEEDLKLFESELADLPKCEIIGYKSQNEKIYSGSCTFEAWKRALELKALIADRLQKLDKIERAESKSFDLQLDKALQS